MKRYANNAVDWHAAQIAVAPGGVDPTCAFLKQTYNNDRPNMGIGGITPAMKLKMAA